MRYGLFLMAMVICVPSGFTSVEVIAPGTKE